MKPTLYLQHSVETVDSDSVEISSAFENRDMSVLGRHFQWLKILDSCFHGLHHGVKICCRLRRLIWNTIMSFYFFADSKTGIAIYDACLPER